MNKYTSKYLENSFMKNLTAFSLICALLTGLSSGVLVASNQDSPQSGKKFEDPMVRSSTSLEGSIPPPRTIPNKQKHKTEMNWDDFLALKQQEAKKAGLKVNSRVLMPITANLLNNSIPINHAEIDLKEAYMKEHHIDMTPVKHIEQNISDDTDNNNQSQGSYILDLGRSVMNMSINLLESLNPFSYLPQSTTESGDEGQSK